MLNRRRFLKTALTAGACGALSRFVLTPALAQVSGYKALVCIFLAGGNDSNNTIVPLDAAGYSQYAAIRGPLALPASSLLAIPGIGGTLLGLHPSLPGLQSLINNNNAAVVANLGPSLAPLTAAQIRAQPLLAPVNLMSHSDQTLAWGTDRNDTTAQSGWGGRLADLFPNSATGFPSVISIAGNNVFGFGASTSPLSVIPGSGLNLVDSDGSANMNVRDNAYQQLLHLPSTAVLAQPLNQTTLAELANAKLLQNAFSTSSGVRGFPATSLGAQLQEVAQIIQVHSQLGAARQIFFCSFGPFDTHSSQLSAQQNLLAQLDGAVSAFQNSINNMGLNPQVTLFTESEFSRSYQPNTGDGTDHAWGGHHFVIGGAVKGGVLYGKMPELALNSPDDFTGRGCWAPSTSLDQYGATLATWFGAPANALNSIFPNLPNFPVKNLGFLG